jgi:Fe-S-cluster-containing hydrogenase component 2
MTSISSATTHKVKKPPAPAVKKPTAGIGKPVAANDEAAMKHQKQVDLVKQRLRVNNADGKCQSCERKKCRKTCNVYAVYYADKAAVAQLRKMQQCCW